jgi:hypothetical protein
MLPFLSLVRALPWYAWALAAALAWGGVEHLRVGSLQGRIDRETAERAAQSLAAEQAARAEETRRTTEHREIANEAERLARRARDAAVRSAAAGDGLRERAAAVAARCNPAAATGGPAAAGPGLVLADVLGRVADAAQRYAAEADRRGIAGQACERAYGTLTPP